MAETTIARPTPDQLAGGPTIRPRRSLPGGRAVIGAFLVVLAAVGTFGAYLQATSVPATTYLVASRELTVGTVLGDDDVAALREVAIDLPDDQAARAVRASQRGALVGTVVVAPVAPDDIVLVSMVQPVGTANAGVQLSFSLPPDRAVGGSIAVGERVDVVATFATGQGGTTTSIVARQVAVVSAPAASEGIGGGRVVLTVQVPDLATAQAVQHAVDVADVALLRGAAPDAPLPAPVGGIELPTSPDDGTPTSERDAAGSDDEEAARTDAAATATDGGSR